jgi:hypothetical protein
VYDGKRLRKSITRRGIDYNANMLNFQKKRKFRRDLRDEEFLQVTREAQEKEKKKGKKKKKKKKEKRKVNYL